MKGFLLMILLACSSLTSAKTLLILGDSLSAGYGMASTESWPALLAERWQHSSGKQSLMNVSVSGSTTQDALARLPSALTRYRPQVVLIELVANDGLRGFPPAVAEQNLRKLIDMVQAAHAQPLLMQIRIPRNYGPAYLTQFEAIYPRLAKDYHIPLLPFFMEKIIGQPELIQADGLHPTAAAQTKICDIMDSQLDKYMVN